MITRVKDFNWDAPPLDADDERLIDAYVSVNRSLDSLPYTDDFERLVQKLGQETSKANMHAAWLRLLSLRKRGRLPRVG